MSARAPKTKRVYEPAARGDGRRILIDRLWPRGVKKEDANLHYWAKDVAPSNALRTWYQHDPKKWATFRKRYFAELDANPGGVAELKKQLGKGAVTIVFGSKEEKLNNATALCEYLAR